MFKLRLSKAMISITCIVFVICLGISNHSQAQQDIGLSKGQAVYVPVYSHIYYGDRETPYYLAVTVSIRNIDQINPITITEVSYYDTRGKLLKRLLDKPMQLNANASTRFVIKESEDKGGSGANCIVKWSADKQVNPPIIESIMIGTRNQQGISFSSRGQAIKEESR